MYISQNETYTYKCFIKVSACDIAKLTNKDLLAVALLRDCDIDVD